MRRRKGADVNGVDFFPDGNAVVSGSEDGVCRLFDLRADQCVQTYGDGDAARSPVTSVAMSKTGRALFAAREDCSCVLWDTLRGEAPRARGVMDDRRPCGVLDERRRRARTSARRFEPVCSS